MQRSDYKEILCTIPMGCLMGGSGCAVACTICTIHNLPYELSNSVLYCLKGKYKSKDLIKCTINEKNNTVYANCQLYWGIASNIVERGNRFRFLGKFKFILQAFLEIVTHEVNEGVLSYLPEEEEELNNNGHYCNKLDERVPDNWVKVKGKFIGAIIVICSNFNQEMKIDNKMDIDTGRICILYARDLNRLQELYMFAKIIDRKSEVSDLTRYKDVCDVVYTKAFRLEHTGSWLTVDGENYGSNGVVQCEIVEGKLNWLTF